MFKWKTKRIIQGRKRPLDTPENKIERGEREKERERERKKERGKKERERETLIKIK